MAGATQKTLVREDTTGTEAVASVAVALSVFLFAFGIAILADVVSIDRDRVGLLGGAELLAGAVDDGVPLAVSAGDVLGGPRVADDARRLDDELSVRRVDALRDSDAHGVPLGRDTR